jgi:polyprenyl-phospho-N-acetylgalactosaminyl synthase
MKNIAVIPAWNEGPRVGEAVLAALKVVDTVVVVDDGSVDETARIALHAGAVVLRHAVNRGQGAALRTGTLAALRLGADVVIHTDADGQHDASDIPRMIAPIQEGRADVVFGSRFMDAHASGIPMVRHALLVAARVFNTLVVGIPSRMTDPQSGMRAFSRAAAERIQFYQDRMAHCSEILRLVTRAHPPLRYMEAPIRVHYTSASMAKGQKTSDALHIVWDLLIGTFRH